ncbi:MAG: AI-2E family transporter [Pseudomonadota bacterium]
MPAATPLDIPQPGHQGPSVPLPSALTAVGDHRLRRLLQLGGVLVVAIGCAMVLRPFLPALLFASVVAISTWPLFRALQRRLGGQLLLPATLLCTVVVVLLIVPAVLVLLSFGDGLIWALGVVEDYSRSAPAQAPDWIVRIPLLGTMVEHWWAAVYAGEDRLLGWLAAAMRPSSRLALLSGTAVLDGLMQVGMAILLLFSLYAGGESLGGRLQQGVSQLAGPYGLSLLAKARQTVTGVMISVIGTGLAQATVALIGFAIAGVPGPLLLSALVFALSLLPIGPPLIWGGAALWLFHSGQPGWSVFMLFYGLFGISSIDNVLRPFLISRSAHLPFALTLISVVGGVLAFGLMGLFLGPVFVALAISMTNHALELGLAPAPRAAQDADSSP